MNWDNALKAAEVGAEQSATPTNLPPIISAKDLRDTQFPPAAWVVENMLPEGVTLLAGKPKIGKSWLALQIGYGVATGGEVLGRPTTQGSVLYAALEDNQGRLKKRMEKTVPGVAEWPDRLLFATEWPRLDKGGLEAFQTWVENSEDARLLIVDTLATVRPANGGRQIQYQVDYTAIRGLHALANKFGIAILVVHHVRKMDADDPFDTVSGSTGLTGAADTTLVLTTTAKGKVLYGRGRDLAEFETAVEFDGATCLWSDLGRPCEAFGSDTRKGIRDALNNGKQTPQKIAVEAGLDYDLCSKTLQRMAESGEVQKIRRGHYCLTIDPLTQ